jgi:hypothetical protein
MTSMTFVDEDAHATEFLIHTYDEHVRVGIAGKEHAALYLTPQAAYEVAHMLCMTAHQISGNDSAEADDDEFV